MTGSNPHDAMDKETAADCEEHNVSDPDLLDGAMTDEDHVAWSDRGKHADPVDPHPRPTKPTQQVGDQGRGRILQEFFFTALHGPVVGLILPQASAIVSNTCSRTKAGFSYANFSGGSFDVPPSVSSGSFGDVIQELPVPRPGWTPAAAAPVRKSDFSQSAEDGPRMFPSMYASPGHLVHVET